MNGIFVIVRLPLKGSIKRKPRFGPGWGLDPMKAGHFADRGDAIAVARGRGDKVITLEQALKLAGQEVKT